MAKSEIIKAMHEQRAVMVDGYDGIFAIVEINLLLNIASLVLLSDDDGVQGMTAKFDKIEVVDDDQD